MANKYYTYIHKDLNGVAFYVGKGSGDRAHRERGSRSKLWNDYEKGKGFEVVIVKDNLTNKEALELEKSLIEFYGRKDLNKGNLVNITNGGVGPNGWKPTKEQRLNNSNAKKGNTFRRGAKLSLESINKIKENRKGKGGLILLDTLSGVYYDTVREAANQYGVKEKTLHNWVTGISKNKSNLITV